MYIYNMKYTLLIILLIITIPVFAQTEDNVFNFNLGNFGFGANLPYRDNYNEEFFLSIISVGIDNTVTNLGAEFSPFHSFGWSGNEAQGGESMFNITDSSIFNLKVYWNILNHYFNGGSNFYIGPFASINYIFVDENFNWDRYIFTAGVHIGFRLNIGKINYNILSGEAGYRNINGIHKYYIGGKIDLVTLFIMVLLVSADR